MTRNVMREMKPLMQNDCFEATAKIKSGFDLSLHSHDTYELYFVQNAKGAKRVVGVHVETIEELELVLIGPDLPHGWFDHLCKSKEIVEISVQFPKDLLDENFLRRNQMSALRKMLQKSVRGILFQKDAIEKVSVQLQSLTEKAGFAAVLELLSILHTLSTSEGMRVLSDNSFLEKQNVSYSSRRIDTVMAHLNKNFECDVTLAEAAELVSMSEVAFSRFFKVRTGKTFIETLNEIRLGHASRLLIDTTQSVSEIAYQCGFNNISNFNRIFKKKKRCTPKAFREDYITADVYGV